MSLESYARNLYAPQAFVDVSFVCIEATIGAAGAVTLDAANSAPSTTIALTAEGRYAVTFPKQERCHVVGAIVEGNDVSPAATEGVACMVNAVNAAAGTLELNTFEITTFALAHPADGSTLHLTLLVSGS